MDKIQGFLEVGLNDANEIVVNHPNLDVDENGVGHIVFSPMQARNLGDLLNRYTESAELNIRRKQEEARFKAAGQIPVDRSARVMTDGRPETPDHREINPATGQQKGYIVLSEAERAKGFVRPVRSSYCHTGKRPKFTTRQLTEEERDRYRSENYVLFEIYPESESPKTGRFWTQKDLNSGCGSVTTMAISIAETYARDPKFYSGTFCSQCRAHFPLDQFVWAGTNEQVGS